MSLDQMNDPWPQGENTVPGYILKMREAMKKRKYVFFGKSLNELSNKDLVILDNEILKDLKKETLISAAKKDDDKDALLQPNVIKRKQNEVQLVLSTASVASSRKTVLSSNYRPTSGRSSKSSKNKTVSPELLPFIRKSNNSNYLNKYPVGGIVKTDSKFSWKLLRAVTDTEATSVTRPSTAPTLHSKPSFMDSALSTSSSDDGSNQVFKSNQVNKNILTLLTSGLPLSPTKKEKLKIDAVRNIEELAQKAAPDP